MVLTPEFRFDQESPDPNQVPRTRPSAQPPRRLPPYVLFSYELLGAHSPPRRSSEDPDDILRLWRLRQTGRKAGQRRAMEWHRMAESGRSCMGAPSTRASGARSLFLRLWWNSRSSYVFSTLRLLSSVDPKANSVAAVGMALAFALVSPARSAGQPPSIYAHVPLEDVWREEQLPR
jgi:hypothetical protein